MEGGRWGLVICFAAFMIQVLAFGLTAAIGVYNIELLDYFDGATVGVSLIGSINYGVFLGSGPIVSFLMTKFSYRQIALAGSLLIAVGVIGMPILPYIPAMCMCFGVLTGFGCCCTYIPSHVLSGLYYDKYRSLATGVSTSGSGLGGAIMPVVVGLLIEYYTWKMSLIVVAGLCLHLFVFAALLRKPPSLQTSSREMEIIVDRSLNLSPAQIADGRNRWSNTHGENEEPVQNEQDLSRLDSYDHFNSNNELPEVSMSNTISEQNGHVRSRAQTSAGHEAQKLIPVKATHAPDHMTRHHSISLTSLHAVGSTRGASVLVLDSSLDGNGSLPLFSTPPQEPNDVLPSQAKLVPNSSRHFFIFTNCRFNIYFCSNIMWNAGCSIINSFAPEFLREKGLTPMEAAWLSGAFGLGCFAGGIFGGVFGNFKFVNRQILYTVSNILMGVLLIVIPLWGHIGYYTVCLVVSGIFFGVILGLLIVVLTDLIGVESLGNGLGYLMLSNGLGTFIGPPLAGLIRDNTGAFDGSIMLAGVLCVFGGLIMFLMPVRHIFCSKCSGQEHH